MRPRIALVTDTVYPYFRGGKEVRYHELARRLSANAEVHVFTMHWWDGPRVVSRDGVTYHAICRRLPLYRDTRRSVRQALWFALGCVRLLWFRFDVLDADHMPYLPVLVCKVVTTLRRRRFVVTWHEVWGSEYWRDYLGSAGRVAWLVERLAMRLPHAIVAASEQTAHRLRHVLGNGSAVVVAPNGIDLDAVRRVSPAADRCDVVVVGRLLNHKRVGLLIDALTVLRARALPVTCCVIGDGPERRRLTEQVRARGLDQDVRFRRDVESQDEIYALVKAARVFVAPSAREGFGVAVLEALACGVPVVTTSTPDNLARHLVERSAYGVVCEPTDVALADAIETVLARPTPPGPPEAWLREYSWDATAARVAGVVLA